MARILLMSIGSRGDMEPFLALGQEMMQRGDTVAFCMPAQFKSLAKEVSPLFYEQDSRLIDLITSPEIKKIMGQVGSPLSRMGIAFRLKNKIKPIQEQLILDQELAVKTFNPDQIIFHIKCIYPVFWALQYNGNVKLLSPMPALLDPMKEQPHVGFGNPLFQSWNLFTYKLAEYALVNVSILGYGKRFIKDRKLNLNAKKIQSFFRDQLTVEYALSEELFQKPHYWPKRAVVTCFRERNKLDHFTPEQKLLDFLTTYPNPLYIGFGSMINSNPKQVAKDILSCCEKHKIAVIINESWGGIECPHELPNWAFKVKDIPYDFLFEKVGKVIHHGGSGTTHSALKHKRPQAIIPHIADQFFWNKQIEKVGVGISGFPIKKWNISNFEHLLLQLNSFNFSEK